MITFKIVVKTCFIIDFDKMLSVPEQKVIVCMRVITSLVTLIHLGEEALIRNIRGLDHYARWCFNIYLGKVVLYGTICFSNANCLLNFREMLPIQRWTKMALENFYLFILFSSASLSLYIGSPDLKTNCPWSRNTRQVSLKALRMAWLTFLCWCAWSSQAFYIQFVIWPWMWVYEASALPGCNQYSYLLL